MFELNGKTILLTGASKGIGAAIARSLGQAGANLVAHYGSDAEGAREAAKDIPPERLKLIGADLSVPSNVDQLWREALGWRGRIDVLINNAAVMRIKGGISDDDATWDDVWDEALRVNVLSPARLMRQAVRHYLGTGGGSIITISSWAAQRGPGNPALIAYAASKGAILSATKTIARNYAKNNILAYMVTPGVVSPRRSDFVGRPQEGPCAADAVVLAAHDWLHPRGSACRPDSGTD